MNKNSYIPEEFIEYIQQYLPKGLSSEQFIQYCQTPLRKAIRVNTLKISVSDFVERANTWQWQLTPIPWCDSGFWLELPESQSQPLGNCVPHLAGWFYIQEASSMLPPTAMSLQQHDCVLDMAAAPGSKTSQIAARLNNTGLVLANEYSASRVKVLHATLSRLGIHNTALSHFDGAVFAQYMPEQFDAVLLDAPCSGEGTIRKDGQAFKNWSLSSTQAIAQTQVTLLSSAVHALKVGGNLVYSTCTLNPIENHQVIAQVLEHFAGALEVVDLGELFPGAQQARTEQGYLHIWPHYFDSEGFFIAKLRKVASTPQSEVKSFSSKAEFKLLPNTTLQLLTPLLHSQFGLKALNPSQLRQRDDEIWLFPEGFSAERDRIKFSRRGIKVADIKKRDIRFNHEFVIAYASQMSLAAEITANQAIEYLQGKDLSLSDGGAVPEHIQQGELLVRFAGMDLGLAKRTANKLKNLLPRDKVVDQPWLVDNF